MNSLLYTSKPEEVYSEKILYGKKYAPPMKIPTSGNFRW